MLMLSVLKDILFLSQLFHIFQINYRMSKLPDFCEKEKKEEKNNSQFSGEATWN